MSATRTGVVVSLSATTVIRSNLPENPVRAATLAFLCVVSIILSGCQSGGEPASSVDVTYESGTGDAAPTTARAMGLVVDDESLPVADANISIDKSEFETTTADDGSYEIAGIPAGTHVVAVLAEGFKPSARQIDAVAGRVVWANFTLDPLPSVEPYVEILPRSAFVDFAQRQLNILVLNQLNQTCQNCKHPIYLEDEPYDLRTEFLFEPTINYPIGSTRVCADYYRNYTGDNPFLEGEFVANACLENRGNDTLQRDPDPACSNCVRTPTDQITMYIVGQEPFDCVGCLPNFPVIQQRVDIWFSIGHHAPLPPGWTALPPPE